MGRSANIARSLITNVSASRPHLGKTGNDKRYCDMLITRSKRQQKLIDDLLFLAGGDIDRLQAVVRAVAKDGAADLKDIVTMLFADGQS